MKSKLPKVVKKREGTYQEQTLCSQCMCVKLCTQTTQGCYTLDGMSKFFLMMEKNAEGWFAGGIHKQRSELQDLKTAQKTKLLILAEIKITPCFKIRHLLAYTQLLIQRTSDLINYVLNDTCTSPCIYTHLQQRLSRCEYAFCILPVCGYYLIKFLADIIWSNSWLINDVLCSLFSLCLIDYY